MRLGISDALSQSDPSTDDLAQAIARLRQSLQDVQADLPAHDKRIYEQDLQQLENQIEALRKSSSSNSKFSFKRNAKKPRNTDSKDLAKIATTPLPPHVATSDPSNLTLSSFTSQTITINSLPSLPTEPRALIISDIRQSLIDLRSLPSLLAFHASEISDSVILLPNVSGSVNLHTLSKCVLVVQCQQVSCLSKSITHRLDHFLSSSECIPRRIRQSFSISRPHQSLKPVLD
jgi:hypothetical protein